jgi:hypothetical protein
MFFIRKSFKRFYFFKNIFFYFSFGVPFAHVTSFRKNWGIHHNLSSLRSFRSLKIFDVHAKRKKNPVEMVAVSCSFCLLIFPFRLAALPAKRLTWFIYLIRVVLNHYSFSSFELSSSDRRDLFVGSEKRKKGEGYLKRWWGIKWSNFLQFLYDSVPFNGIRRFQDVWLLARSIHIIDLMVLGSFF